MDVIGGSIVVSVRDLGHVARGGGWMVPIWCLGLIDWGVLVVEEAVVSFELLVELAVVDLTDDSLTFE